MIIRATCGFGLLTFASPALAYSTCSAAIEMQKDAADMQWSSQFQQSVWTDGTAKWPGKEATRWSEIGPRGGGRKYRTFHREVMQPPVRDREQTIQLKAIVTRVSSDGRYSGDYSVNKVTYICEARGGEWRILDQIVHQRNDFVNERAAAAFEESGGWDGVIETKL